jgi:hypothetical protein
MSEIPIPNVGPQFAVAEDPHTVTTCSTFTYVYHLALTQALGVAGAPGLDLMGRISPSCPFSVGEGLAWDSDLRSGQDR